MTDELDTTIGGEAAANPPSETGGDAEFEAKLEAEHLAFTSALYERLVVGQDGDAEAVDGVAQSSAAEPDAAALSNAAGPLDCAGQSSAAGLSFRDSDLTHVNEQGRARMVDVGGKPVTSRVARASAKVLMAPSTLELVRTGGTRKGDVLAVAQVGGIMAAKRTSELIPMCHQVPLSGVDINFSYEADGIAIVSEARCKGETGVEMEALVAASTAALTIYDMCKSHQRDMVISEVCLLEKDGGRSGHFVRGAKDAC